MIIWNPLFRVFLQRCNSLGLGFGIPASDLVARGPVVPWSRRASGSSPWTWLTVVWWSRVSVVLWSRGPVGLQLVDPNSK